MENSLEQIAQTGLLGVLLVLSLFVVAFLYKEVKNERNARLEDLKETTTTNSAFIKEIKTYMESVLSLLRIKQ